MDTKQYSKLLEGGGAECREQEISDPQNEENAIAFCEKVLEIAKAKETEAQNAQ